MDISLVYRLSILGSSTGLPQTSNSLSFALWKRGHNTRHDGRTPEQGMSKSGSALPFHIPWMLLQSKLNLVKTVAELMKEALIISHAAIRNNLLCKGHRTAAYIKVYQSTQKHFVLSYLIPHGINMVQLGIKQQAKFRVL